MISEREYKDLKEEVEEAKNDAQRAKGGLAQLNEQLKEEFDCDLGEAQSLLKTLEKKKDEAQEAYERAEKSYRKKWKPNGE